MPIVTVQIVGAATPPSGAESAQRLADALGDVFGSEPGTAWVRVIRLPRECYAENRTELPDSVQPVFVEVLHGSVPDADALADQARDVARVVADAVARPVENVHVLYLPPGHGRIAFGGNLVRG